MCAKHKRGRRRGPHNSRKHPHCMRLTSGTPQVRRCCRWSPRILLLHTFAFLTSPISHTHKSTTEAPQHTHHPDHQAPIMSTPSNNKRKAAATDVERAECGRRADTLVRCNKCNEFYCEEEVEQDGKCPTKECLARTRPTEPLRLRAKKRRRHTPKPPRGAVDVCAKEGADKQRREAADTLAKLGNGSV